MAIRKVAAFLRPAGMVDQRWTGGTDLAAREAEGPCQAAKRGRLWLTDGSWIRLRSERANHVWSHDFVEERTHHGRRYRTLKADQPHTCRMHTASKNSIAPNAIEYGASQWSLLIIQSAPLALIAPCARGTRWSKYLANAFQKVT